VRMRSVILILFCCFPTALFAEERVIELTDGSRIVGEVTGMSGGVYTVRSRALGTIELDSARVHSISRKGTADAAAGTSAGAGPLGSIQSTIAQDAGLMAKIMSLRDDPRVQAVLTDPEVMAAVRSLDFETLRHHPKFKALMNDPEVRGITSGLK